MGFGTSLYWGADNIGGSDFWYAIPFGLSAKDMYAWLFRGGGLELWRDLYEPFNVIPFPIGNTGGAMGGWFKNEIPETDFEKYFEGLNIRAMGLREKVYQKLKANTLNSIRMMNANDAYIRNEIKAIVGLGPYTDLKYKLYHGPKYYYYPGWQEPCGILSIIINKDAWNNLPDNLKRTIEVACGNTYQYISNQFDSMNAKAIPELEKEGVIFKEFPPKLMAKFRELTNEVLEEEAAKNAQFKRIYEAFKKFKESNVDTGWGKYMEDAVYSETAAQKFIKGLGTYSALSARQEGNNSIVITFSGDTSFGSWSSVPKPVLASEIARIATIIKNYPYRWIKVEGHSATDGEEYPNWAISKKRADAVADLLVSNGIDRLKIKVIAYGESNPLIEVEKTEADRSKNRRVEITIEF